MPLDTGFFSCDVEWMRKNPSRGSAHSNVPYGYGGGGGHSRAVWFKQTSLTHSLTHSLRKRERGGEREREIHTHTPHLHTRAHTHTRTNTRARTHTHNIT